MNKHNNLYIEASINGIITLSNGEGFKRKYLFYTLDNAIREFNDEWRAIKNE